MSAHIAVAVAEVAYQRGLARAPEPDDVMELVRSYMFEPGYQTYV